MSLPLTEVVRALPGEEERLVFLDDELIAIGRAPLVLPGDGFIIGWPVKNALLKDLIDQATRLLLMSNATHAQLDLEFWINDTFYERRVPAGTSGQTIVDLINQQRFAARDVLQLVRYGTPRTAIEFSFSAATEPIQATVIADEIRLSVLVPLIADSHESGRVRSDREVILLVLQEPGQMSGAIHLLRPGKVIP